MEPLVHGKIGKVFKVFFDHGVFGKKADIVFQFRTDHIFTEDNDKGVK